MEGIGFPIPYGSYPQAAAVLDTAYEGLLDFCAQELAETSNFAAGQQSGPQQQQQRPNSLSYGSSSRLPAAYAMMGSGQATNAFAANAFGSNGTERAPPPQQVQPYLPSAPRQDKDVSAEREEDMEEGCSSGAGEGFKKNCGRGGTRGSSSKLALKEERGAIEEVAVLREKNRKAQAKFRSRQKAKLQESEEKIQELAGQLNQLRMEKSTLENRNMLLETVVRMQQKEAPASSSIIPLPSQQQALVSKVITSRLAELLDGRTSFTLTVTAEPTEVSVEQTKTYGWTDLARLWKEYVSKMASALVEANGDALSGAGRHIQLWLREIQTLLYSVAVHNPRNLQRFKSLRMEAVDLHGREEPTREMWRSVVNSMNLSQEQKERIVELRRYYLLRLGAMLRRRKEISQQLQAAMPSQLDDVGQFTAAHMRALEHAEAFNRSVVEEQECMAEFSISTQKIVDVVQIGIAIVQSYPWVPDGLAMYNCLAEDMGAPSAAKLLTLGAEQGNAILTGGAAGATATLALPNVVIG